MTEETHRKWDIAIKILGFTGIILSGAVGISQYADTKEREFYSKFWNQRLHLYVKTLDTAAKISAAKTSEESEIARADFKTLFDGSMAVVQDEAVDTAMHEFDQQLSRLERGEIKREDLGSSSYQLGRVCYDSLRNSWNKPFSSLRNAKQQ